MNLFKFFKIKKGQTKGEGNMKASFEEGIEAQIGDAEWWNTRGRVGERAATVPNRSLQWRALTAYEIQDSESMGGGHINVGSYLGGIKNAIARCCAMFGINPLDVTFRHKEGDWYQVEIEDITLLTQDYYEYFGMFYWLVAPCPYCKQSVGGAKMIGNLHELGGAIKKFEPGKEHLKKCPAWSMVQNCPGFDSDFDAEVPA